MRPVIVLFAKAPVPGLVKTRLEPVLGREGAARFHAACVRAMLQQLSVFREVADLELHTDTPTDAWSDCEVAAQLQIPGDLGLKMFHTLNAALAGGRPRVLIAGSDAPTLPRAHLGRLLAAAADVAFGPTEDGGYYAVCCRRVHPAMFDGVDWSTPRALAQSERAALACGLTTERGDPWYDLDAPADLLRLAGSPDAPAWLREFLP